MDVVRRIAMRRFTWLLLALCPTLPGCDVAMMMLLSGQDSGSEDDDASSFVASSELDYRVWIAQVTDDHAAANALVLGGGKPQGPLWTPVGAGSRTTIFNPEVPPDSINAILVQVLSKRHYVLDSVEVLDDLNRVVEHASGMVWSDRVMTPDRWLGPPDGIGSLTQGIDTADAFIFTRFNGPIDKFRINAMADGGIPISGDVLAMGGYSSTDNERPGGLAIDTLGRIHLTLSVDDEIRLVRYGLDGSFVDGVQIENDITFFGGSHAVALDPDDEIYTASTVSDGKVYVKQFHPSLVSGWSRTFSSGKHQDRVEPNGIAVDGSGDVVVTGAMNSGQGLNHWLAKMERISGAVIFDDRPAGDLGNTYWRGVTTGAANLIYTTGNQTSGFFGVVQVVSNRFSSNGSTEWANLFGDSETPEDIGHAISLDGEGNLIIGGCLGTTSAGRNAILVQYDADGILSKVKTFSGAANGDDEILDIAVDADGSVYVCGYETVAAQGRNFWVRKYDADFNPVWMRTHDGGAGDDVAISLAIHEDRLVVAGQQTVAGGMTKFVLRVYAK